jgi:RNA polymerase sigma factor (sigma-70 family)
VFGFCVNQLGSRDEAEDAVQSTFLNAHRALQRGVTPEAELAWLFKIAHNVCLTRRRSSRRRGRVESPSDLDAVQDILPAPARESADELIRLTDALSHMPDNQRRAILLREWQGLSYHEIADELQLSQSAVETLIFRARRTLAANLEVEPERPSALARVRKVLDIGSLLGAVKTLIAAGTAMQATAAAVAVSGAAVVATSPPVRHHFTPPAKVAAAPAIAKPKAPAATSVRPITSTDAPVHLAAAALTARRAKAKPAHVKPDTNVEAAAATPPSVNDNRTQPSAPPAVTAAPPAPAPTPTPAAAPPAAAPPATAVDHDKDKAKAETPAPPRGADEDKGDRGGNGDKKDKDKGHEQPKAEAPAAAPPQKVGRDSDGDRGDKKDKGDKGKGKDKDNAPGSPKFAPPVGAPITPPAATEQPPTTATSPTAPSVSTPTEDDDDDDDGKDKERGKGKHDK